MRIVHINVTAAFSTGRIAVELCRQAMREGHRALLCYARGSCPSDVPGYRIGSIDTALSFCRGWQTESPHRPRAQ